MESKEQSNSEYDDSGRFDLELLSIGKRIGLSFDEINELRVVDLFALAEIHIGKEKPRQATQADIDAFYGG